MLIAILAAGTLVAVVGLAQWATWNGKILWVMVPYDWGAPDLGVAARRASGPFVNPDHFAGYLATIFPLALAGLIFGGFPARSGSGPATRVMYGFATFLIFTAVALSLSRAGWIGLAIGTSLVIGCVLAAAVTRNAWWLIAAPLCGYGFAWIGHYFFEKNRPATFTHPFYSFVGDWVGEWNLGPADAFAAVLDGRTILHLQDGLEVRRGKVMGDFRIEVSGFTDGMVDRLKAMGLVSEIIAWKLRLFVPVGTGGPAILGALTERYPLVRIAERPAA